LTLHEHVEETRTPNESGNVGIMQEINESAIKENRKEWMKASIIHPLNRMDTR
jgi:hypothetical protein